MQRIGIWTNAGKDPGLELTRQLVGEIQRQGAIPCLPHAIAEAMGREELAAEPIGKDVICIVVLGGDGTILTAVQQARPYGVPILGINLGRLGFLAESEAADFSQVVHRLLSGDYWLEERTMLSSSLDDKPLSIALNDVVISRGRTSNMIRIEVRVGGQTVDQFSGDGLVIATPTGSTAYALSVGGPIVSPALQGIVLAPICPHTLHARPIIVPDTDEIEVLARANSGGEVAVSIDGRLEGYMEPTSRILVTRSAYKARFARLSRRNFYELLQRKLTEWSGPYDAT